MAFLHARLLEHLKFQFAPSALDEAALAGRREEGNPKISIHLPSSGRPSPACLHPCKCGFPLVSSYHPSLAALGLLAAHGTGAVGAASLAQGRAVREAAGVSWARRWQGRVWGCRGSA